MRSLIKTDMRRIFKDKLFLVVCALGVILAFFTPLLYKGLATVIGMDDELLGLLTDSKSMFFSAFATGNNFGLILPILLSLVLCKDFGYGTVRNKIICGKSRAKIFFSMFFSGTIVMCGTILLHALLTLGIALCFFPYQAEKFTANSFGYMMLSILFSLMIYVFISAFVCLLCVSMKNAELAVIIYVAANLISNILGGIISAATLIGPSFDKFPTELFEILSKINLFNATYIGKGMTYSTGDVLCLVIASLVGTGLCLLLGVTVFRKKDIK